VQSAASSAQGLPARGSLATLFATGVVQIWQVLTLSFIVGTAQSFGGPAYQALIPTLVKSRDLPNAIALNSMQFNLARVIGPVLGALALAAMGAAWCFTFNAISFIGVIITLLIIRPHFVPTKTGESVLNSMRQGFQFIRTQSAMEGLILLAFSMTLLAFPLIVILPVFARNVFHGDPKLYSMLLVSLGIGSTFGALIVAGLGKYRHMGRSALVMLTALGCLLTGFAMSRSLVLSCVLLFLSGGTLLAVFTTISSLVQMITSDQMRGRVMSVYNVAFRGGTPFGSLIVGALVKEFSAPRVIAGNGILLALLGLYFLLVQRKVATL
jgi:predicted MFS family arabinose efflux permease